MADIGKKSFKPTRERKLKKRRKQQDVFIDNSEVKKVKLDLDYENQNYDDCNTLVLPSSKRKTVKKVEKSVGKLLSKKQKKRLTKLLDLKEKKLKREDLLESLKKVQAKQEDLVGLTSLQETQTLGRKIFSDPKYLYGDEENYNTEEDNNTKMSKIKSIKQCKHWSRPPSTKKERKKKYLEQQQLERALVKEKYAVYPSSSSSENESSEEDDEPLEVTISNTNNFDSAVSREIIKESKDIPIENHNSKITTKANEEINQKLNESSVSCDDGTGTPKTNKPSPKISSSRKNFRLLKRDSEMQNARLKLPILSEEHRVMEAINENPVVLIVGNTGSGKTTQVPQFLFEAGFTSNGQMIGVTEPRRVAAIAMSDRVATEMSLSSDLVSYQVRFDGNATKQTEIKFMTDGILLNELQESNLLMNYSAIILDEAHERNVQSDVLIGLLSIVVRKRENMQKPLKLVIMSATLRVNDFVENKLLFPSPPPIVKIDSSMFDVTVHFDRKTNPEYVYAAYKKVSQIHKKLPDGTILVFLTGQSEIYALKEMLEEDFPSPSEKEDNNLKKKCAIPKKIPEINLEDFVTVPKESSGGNMEVIDEEELDDDGFFNAKHSDTRDFEMPLDIRLLYAKLPAKKQRKVFEPALPGCRVCVIATNVAETSLTIPNVKYVVDSGKIKQKVYDPITGVSSFKIVWTSKASLAQRKGRAGRMSSGHCYRLFSSAVYEDECSEYLQPEILRRPIDDIVLSLKAMSINIGRFPFPTNPDQVTLQTSLKRLTILGALKSEKEQDHNLIVTDKDLVTTKLGDLMAQFPVAPQYAKMILLSSSYEGATDYMILIISALTYPEVLEQIDMRYKGMSKKMENLVASRHRWEGNGRLQGLGDILVLINAINDAEKHGGSAAWCEENGLRQRDFLEIQKLRRQIATIVKNDFKGISADPGLGLVTLTHDLASKICCIMLHCCYEFVAQRVNYAAIPNPTERRKWKNAYKCMNFSEPVFISTMSVVKQKPKYVLYHDIYRNPGDLKTFIRCVSTLAESWLPVQVPQLCIFSPPMEKPVPSYNETTDLIMCSRKATFGPSKWELGPCQVPFPKTNDLYKWAAYFFLEGKLCTELLKFKPLLHDPSTLIRLVCVRFTQIREKLVGAFKGKDIKCFEDLKIIWKQHPSYLLKEYLTWFEDQSKQSEITKLWPPLPKTNLMLIE